MSCTTNQYFDGLGCVQCPPNQINDLQFHNITYCDDDLTTGFNIWYLVFYAFMICWCAGAIGFKYKYHHLLK